jgi:hypothetical protein
LLQQVAAAAGDHLAVDQHVELTRGATFAGDADVEGVFDLRGETRRARPVASGGAVADADVHGAGYRLGWGIWQTAPCGRG